MPWLLGYRVRTYRIAAAVMIVVGIPSLAINWSGGRWWAIGIFAAHVYIGLTIALLFPYLQRRVRERRTAPEE